MKPWLLILVCCSSPWWGTACSSESSQGQRNSSPDTAWLQGDVNQRFHLVAKHLRGFDMAMVETGHRYAELYWAGRDQNWDYAEYQLGKIEIAVANGSERRPARAESARMLDEAVQGVRAAIGTRDGRFFETAFVQLTNTCNKCHAAEKVDFIHVAPPKERLSPVGPK